MSLQVFIPLTVTFNDSVYQVYYDLESNVFWQDANKKPIENAGLAAALKTKFSMSNQPVEYMKKIFTSVLNRL